MRVEDDLGPFGFDLLRGTEASDHPSDVFRSGPFLFGRDGGHRGTRRRREPVKPFLPRVTVERG